MLRLGKHGRRDPVLESLHRRMVELRNDSARLAAFEARARRAARSGAQDGEGGGARGAKASAATRIDWAKRNIEEAGKATKERAKRKTAVFVEDCVISTATVKLEANGLV